MSPIATEFAALSTPIWLGNGEPHTRRTDWESRKKAANSMPVLLTDSTRWSGQPYPHSWAHRDWLGYFFFFPACDRTLLFWSFLRRWGNLVAGRRAVDFWLLGMECPPSRVPSSASGNAVSIPSPLPLDKQYSRSPVTGVGEPGRPTSRRSSPAPGGIRPRGSRSASGRRWRRRGPRRGRTGPARRSPRSPSRASSRPAASGTPCR